MAVPVTAYDGRSEEEIMAANNQRMNADAQLPQQRANAALLARLDPSNPNYVGPGYAQGPTQDGKVTLRIVDRAAHDEWLGQQRQAAATTATPALPTAPRPPAAPQTIQERLAAAAESGVGRASNAGFLTTPLTTRQLPISDSTRANLAARTAPIFRSFDLPRDPNATPTAPDAAQAAPVVDETKIQGLLDNINSIQAQIQGLSGDDEGFAQARAELTQAMEAAKQGALSLARGGSRRGTSALLSQAMGEQAALTADESQSAAVLRAQQEDQKRKLELDIQNTAAGLGLQEAGLQIRTEGLNLESAANYLDQLFQDKGLKMRVDEREAGRITEFVRDMALVQADYDRMNQADKNAFLDRLIREHGINESTSAALKQIAASEPGWLDVGIGILKTAGPIAALAIASDERVKTDIRDTTDDELAELLSTFKPKAYAYRDPARGAGEQFGGMAQDLERTSLGRGMVSKDRAGVRQVDGGKAGMAALAGVALLYDKLKDLENG